MSLTLDTARSIIAGARAHGSQAGFKPLTVVVLDAGGHVVAVEREDGASMSRFEIGFGKAYGALSLGMGSRSIIKVTPVPSSSRSVAAAAAASVMKGSRVR